VISGPAEKAGDQDYHWWQMTGKKPTGEEFSIRVLCEKAPMRDAGAPGRIRRYILREGTDARYGARHLKRSIERLLVQPIANLMASGQIRAGDWIRADCGQDSNALTFFRDAESMTAYNMSEVARTGGGDAASAAAA
jgi:hypothetical protein